jgi:aspartate/methionine/tyrosine aminotransferase
LSLCFASLYLGNPTGNCLSKEQLVQVVKIAEKHNVMILADEVYQINVYNPDLKFVSMKKVVRELGSKVPLISFHSTSKG